MQDPGGHWKRRDGILIYNMYLTIILFLKCLQYTDKIWMVAQRYKLESKPFIYQEIIKIIMNIYIRNLPMDKKSGILNLL